MTALLVEVHADIQMVRRRQAVVVTPADIVDRNVFTRRCDEGRASGRDSHTVSAHKRPGRGEVDAGTEFVAHTGVDDVPPVELGRKPLAIVDAAVPEYSFSLREGVGEGSGGLSDNFAGVKFQTVGASLAHHHIVFPVDGR